MREFVGPYRILEALGRGGMGVVYRGIHDQLRRSVAIKALAPELTKHPHFRERFFSEARTQAQLQHPNIITIYDLIEDEGEYFIVMELVEGAGLDEMLAELGGRGMELDLALEIFRQILAALQSAHTAGVIHRDVKPSNVLISKSGEVKLMDFGIALLVGDKRLTQSSQTIGTPVYMSPEQILRPREVDHRTDLYSAAVMLFEMLSGRPPFDAETEYEIKKQHIETSPLDVATLRQEVPPGVAEAILVALRKSPEERFSNAQGFLLALGPAASTPRGGTEPPASPQAPSLSVHRSAAHSAPAPSSPLRQAHRTGLVIGTAASAAVVLLAIGFLIFRDGIFPAPPKSESAAAGGATRELLDRAELQAQIADQAAARATESSRQVSSAGRLEASPGPLRERAEREPESTPSVPTKPSSEPQPEPVSLPPKRPQRDVEAEIRKKTVARVREQVREGIAEIERQMTEEDYVAAKRKVGELSALAAKYRAELVDEVVTLRLLEGQISDADLAQRVEEKERLARTAAWEEKLEEIQRLLDEQSFPEARNLARLLLSEEALPRDLADRAQECVEFAEQGLKGLFKQTDWGETTSTLQVPEKKKKKNRNEF